MGNCSHKAITGKCPDTIRIMTDSGCVVELESPKLVRDILHDFPGHGIFRMGDMSSPLSDQERLSSGQFYYLLPLGNASIFVNNEATEEERAGIRTSSGAALDIVEDATNGSSLEVLPSAENGVWRVKMVISTDELEKILSEQVSIEALIEKMRVAATSSTCLTPKRTRSSWGANWNWKPTLYSVFRLPIIDQK